MLFIDAHEVYFQGRHPLSQEIHHSDQGVQSLFADVLNEVGNQITDQVEYLNTTVQANTEEVSSLMEAATVQRDQHHDEVMETFNKVVRKKEDGIGRVGRYNCHACNASFKVTCGTVFHGTQIPLQKWLLAIALILNAKKGLSTYQLQRDLDLKQKLRGIS